MVKNILIKTPQRCKDYALWYYFRYYPSQYKLYDKLQEKTDYNQELVHLVFNDIKHLFNEAEVLESKIQNLLFRNKNKNYIRLNLLQKKFKKEDIESILSKLTEEGKSILDESFLERKIQNLKNKNKSIQYIKNKLIEQPEDREIVEKVINIYYPESNEDRELQNEYNKLFHKNITQQKIIDRLLRKGYQYGDIKKLF
ncbi:MAG: hypothetical protein GY828_04790 [Candidatus Gracilibacteria bacterium]|nr:hypothetical protein [Candidatus Gracilibacteria bacterium]